MSYENLKLKNQLCHRFYVASNGITRAYRPLLEKLDVTYPQYVVLMALWEKDAVAIQEIMDATKIDGGSLTQILSKLEKKSILRLAPSKEDKRKKIVCLTAEGKKLKAKAKSIPEAMACKINSLSKTEVKTLVELLDKINQDFS